VSTFARRELSSERGIVAVRSAVEDDAPRILEVMLTVLRAERCFHTIQADEVDRDEAKQRARIRAFAEAPRRIILVAEAEEAAGPSIVGFAELENGFRRRMAHKVSGFVSVLPEWRALGVGRALAVAIRNWVYAEPGVEKVSFTVLATNEASLALTRGFGMQEEAVLRREVRIGPEEYVDLIVMSILIPRPS